MAGSTVSACSSDVDGCRRAHEVWSSNFEEEFDAFSKAVNGDGTIIAFDSEFPGFVSTQPPQAPRGVKHETICNNVDSLHPIQFGFAIGKSDGMVCGVWNFNLSFDIDLDMITSSALSFLRAAGIDFPRHAREGIDRQFFGKRLRQSKLFQCKCLTTFSGEYDLGYFLKLITQDRLPKGLDAFDKLLSEHCPIRCELREWLPYGSLEALAEKYGIQRCGAAHTAGSDALVTLDLCFVDAASCVRTPAKVERAMAFTCNSKPCFQTRWQQPSGRHIPHVRRRHGESLEAICDQSSVSKHPSFLKQVDWKLKLRRGAQVESANWGAFARDAAVLDATTGRLESGWPFQHTDEVMPVF